MIRRINILGVLLLFVVAVASCRYNELEPAPGVSSGGNKGDGQISFVLGNTHSEEMVTKGGTLESEQTVRELLTVTDTDSLFLVASVVDNNDQVFHASSPVTKGETVTSDNIGEFYVTAFIRPEDASPQMKYFNNVMLSDEDKSSQGDVTLYTIDYYWPKGRLDFFASNFRVNKASTSLDPLDEVTANPGWTTTKSSSSFTTPVDFYGYDQAGECVAKFGYSLPKPDLSNKNDAQNQPDYVVAISDRMTEDANGGVVPLNFAHCFTAVVFKIGDDFLSPEGRQVKQVEIVGVPSIGECTYRISNTGGIAFDWNTEGAHLETYRQVIATQGNDTNVDNKEPVNDGALTFMLIPHMIDEDALVRITFGMHTGHESAHETVVEKKIVDLFPGIVEKKWLAGKKYIYTIASEEKVDVTVEDKFISAKVKGNLQITNKGTVPAYARAMIVGWWENESGAVVAPWNESDGTFTGKGWGGNNSDWTVGEDGFYYYKNPLGTDESTSKLFDTYTLKAAPPTAGARLILTIVTQGVAHYRVADAWPVTFSGTSINGFVSNNGSYWQ